VAWTSTGSLNVSPVGQGMTLLLNGQVLAAGGESFDKSTGTLVPLASAELFNP
jgi:N-acetylneuraminic acid mutarotase